MTIAPKTRSLTRDQIAQFVGSQRGIRAFEDVQSDMTDIYAAVAAASFVTVTDEPSLGAERKIAPDPIDIIGTDGGPNGTYALTLAETAVSPGSYGDASHTISASVDAKGRITNMQPFALNTDNITEGGTNLFFTTARARASVSGTGGITYNSGTGAISLDTASNRNVDHSAVSISAGSGLTGGGDLTANRALALATSGVTPGTYTLPTSITVDSFGRITAIS